MLLRYACVFAAVLLLGATADAQVQGVCVSGCYIPKPTRPEQQSPSSTLDPRLIQTGMAAEIRGDVTLIYPNGQRVKASATTPIAYGTRVITGPGSRASFILLDETSFSMQGDSEMVLDAFVYDPDTSFKKMSIRIAKGAFRYVTGKVAPRDYSNMKINTPVGCICIRGTDVEAFIDPFGSGRVVLHHGSIDFEEYDTGRVITMRGGQTLRYENFVIQGVD